MIKLCNADLLSALKAVAVAMPSRPIDPVFGGFYIHAEDDWLEITCSDAAFTITAQTNLDERTETMDAVVSGKGLLDWCGRVDKGADICMDFDGDAVKVSASLRGKVKSRSVFAVMDAEKFPKSGLQQYVTMIAMPSDKLHDAFRSVVHCVAAQGESKEVLKGVNLCYKGTDELLTTALDGFRMAVKRSTIVSNVNLESFNVTVPFAFAKAVTGIIPLGGDVNLVIYPSSVRVAADNITIETRLIKGEYPDVAKIKPKTDGMPTLTVDKTEMVGALNRALLAGANNNLVVLTGGTEYEMSVAARSETARMDETVTVSNHLSADIDAAFNGEYLRQAVSAYDDGTEKCDITLVNGGMQAVIDDGSLYQLVLGVRRLKK